MMAGLAVEHCEKKTMMIDATYLKAHRTATSMGVKKGGLDAFLLDTRDADLPVETLRLKKRIKKAKAQASA